MILCHTAPKNYITEIEQLHSVIIQPYINYVMIRGYIFQHIEDVRSNMEEQLKLHYISSGHNPNSEVPSTS